FSAAAITRPNPLEGDARFAAQRGYICIGNELSLRRPFLNALDAGHAQDSLELGHASIQPHHLAIVASAIAVVARQTKSLRQLDIVRRYDAAFTGHQQFCRTQTEHFRVSAAANRFPMNSGPKTMGSVKDQFDAVLLCDRL